MKKFSKYFLVILLGMFASLNGNPSRTIYDKHKQSSLPQQRESPQSLSQGPVSKEPGTIYYPSNFKTSTDRDIVDHRILKQ